MERQKKLRWLRRATAVSAVTRKNTATQHCRQNKTSPISAAFDTIDHVTLINRLRTSFGITGSVLSWLQSYLSNRTQLVHIGHHSSTSTRCTTGVPQGSVLGPLLFVIYISPIAIITRSFQVCHQQYADDTQLFIALNPSDPSPDIANLTTCLHALHSWFCVNGMALNPDKSDAILLGTRQRSRTFASVRSVDVAGCPVLLSDSQLTAYQANVYC